jgi:predicted dithiol-disulfide oxidoreductase (DUF899 family)
MAKSSLPETRFPGETVEYRRARNKLLQAEVKLRRQIEAVAGQTHALSLSFRFPESVRSMTPCPSCTSIIDAVDGAARHVTQRVNFAVIAKAPIDRFRAASSFR